MFRPHHLRRYVALMQERGFDGDAVLAHSGLRAEDLNDPNCLVSLEQSQAVVTNMIRLTRDSGLGFAVGQATQLADLGIVGHAIMSAKSMRQVTTLWVQYSNHLVGSLLRISLEEGDADSAGNSGAWTLRVVESGTRGSIYAFCVEEFMAMGMNIGSVVASVPFKARQIQLSYPRPEHGALYETLFDCPVRFDAPSTAITVESPDLNLPLRNNDAAFNEICVRHCHQVMRQIASQSPLISRLRSMFLQKSDHLPDMADAARELGMSVRTLRRRLLEEHTNYQDLLDRYRCDLAVEYLKSGHMTPKEVGYLLGFRHPTTFRRAFRGWTGQTIGEFLASPSADADET
jgi:AraC-like DNA-binding protein